MRWAAAAVLFNSAIFRCKVPSSVFSAANTSFSSRFVPSLPLSALLSALSLFAPLSPLSVPAALPLSCVSRFANGSFCLAEPLGPSPEPIRMPRTTPSPASSRKRGIRRSPFFDFPPSVFFSSGGVDADGLGCSAVFCSVSFRSACFLSAPSAVVASASALAIAAVSVCSVAAAALAPVSSVFSDDSTFMPQLVQNFAPGFNLLPQYLQYISFPPLFFRVRR